jgi:ABC-2 type transport system permease protein
MARPDGCAVKVATDSMPTGLRWFAEYQIAWCVAITVASYVWARTLFNRDPVR